MFYSYLIDILDEKQTFLESRKRNPHEKKPFKPHNSHNYSVEALVMTEIQKEPNIVAQATRVRIMARAPILLAS